jgi:hypothetical protein
VNSVKKTKYQNDTIHIAVCFFISLSRFWFGFENYRNSKSISYEYLQICSNIFLPLKKLKFYNNSMVAYEVWDHRIFSPVLYPVTLQQPCYTLWLQIRTYKDHVKKMRENAVDAEQPK